LNALGCATEGKRGRQGDSGVGAVWREGTGKKRGPGAVGERLGLPASAPGRWVRAAALPRNRGGRRGADDTGATTEKWGRATVGPGGQRLGAGGRGSAARR
jgi:hypothetical protein